jgi:hypothetical protein
VVALALPVGIAGAAATSNARPVPRAVSQQVAPSPIIGTWDLVAVSTRWANGRVTEPWGRRPIGRMSYGSDGRMSALLMDARRNQASGRAVPADMLASAASYYGTYSIDTVRRVITHKVVASLRATEAGTQERGYVVQGDTLTLTQNATFDGAPITHRLLLRRSE